jgi:signal transduction histidine kinase
VTTSTTTTSRMSHRGAIWAPVTFLLVAALAIGAWAGLRGSVASQDKALLANQEAQVVLLLQQAFQNFQTQLRSVAYFTANSNGSAQVFADQSKPLLTSPAASVAVADVSGPAAVVTLASGPDLHQGQPLPAPVAALVQAASPSIAGSVVHVGGRAMLVMTATTQSARHVVALSTTELDQTRAVPNRSGPYAHIYIELYASTRPDRGQLVLSTYGPRPLPAPVASSVLKVGAIEWLVQAGEKSTLAGSTAEAAPWLVLGLGLLLAVALALAVETFVRRERRAAELVEARTAELLEAQQSLLRNERLAALGELATVVGHELRNPLGAAINDLYLHRIGLADRISDEEMVHVGRAETQIHRAARLSEDLTAYMRERQPVLTEVDVAALVEDLTVSSPPPEGVRVEADAPVHLNADANLLTQVLTNLLTNAYQAMEGAGRVRVTTVADGDAVVLAVEDDGPGFGDDVAERALDPFFTTKTEGTGLGLAIVHRLVQLHGGSVAVANGPGGGGRVAVRIPADGTRP